MERTNQTPLFQLGRVHITQRAQALGIDYATYLSRHIVGDGGSMLTRGDIAANELALSTGDRIISYYKAPTGDGVIIITDQDCSLTTVILADEYDDF